MVTIAYVAKVDTAPGTTSNFLEAYPIEITNEHIGSVNDTETLVKDIIINGNKETVKVNKSVTIKAEWLPISQSNRASSPNVVVGEFIALYRFDKVDKFYWDTFMNDISLRRLESVLTMYGNTNVYGEELTLENSYWSLVDTKTKCYKFHMSDNDGELTTYDIHIDGKKGFAELKDGRGNYFKLDSKADCVDVFTNKKIHFKTKDIHFECDNYTLDASKTITEKTKTFTHTSDTGTASINNYTLKGKSYNLTYGNSTLKTNITLTGNYGQKGNMDVKGKTTLNGGAQIAVSKHSGGVVL